MQRETGLERRLQSVRRLGIAVEGVQVPDAMPLQEFQRGPPLLAESKQADRRLKLREQIGQWPGPPHQRQRGP
jgi:hypothetical protein